MQKIQMAKKDNFTMSDLMRFFIRKCKIKNLSEHSITSYEQKCNVFLTYVGGDTLTADITPEHINNFILYLKNTGSVNDISINSYLRSIRALLYYGMECGYIVQFKIPLIKAEKKVKETYTDAELERLLKRPDVNSCDFEEYKIWAFENYLLGTGNRISTALNVRIKDIDFADGTILLRKTKNRKQQIIPLSPTLADVLTEYLQYRGGEEEDYLFCNNYGQKADIRTYQQLIRNYNISRNVNKAGAHLFRHTFAKHWVMSKGDPYHLQKILGHSDLTVTKEYVAMFGQDLQMDFESFCPLDQLKSAEKQKGASITMKKKGGGRK